MAGNYVQVVPDSTGKKVEAEILQQDSDTVARQVVKLADGRDIMIADTLTHILSEVRELRRVICNATNQSYEEQLETIEK